MRLLVFVPTYGDGPRRETLAAVRALQFDGELTVHVSRHNPYPVPDPRNVTAQYQQARSMVLDGNYDYLLTVEHDMLPPLDAIERMAAINADVVYAAYALRHGSPSCVNLFQYTGGAGTGMSLSYYPAELAEYRRRGTGRVSGVGWGCTLIKRHVLELIEIRDDTSGQACDIPFAEDCIKHGLLAVGAFGVEAAHWNGERWLMPYEALTTYRCEALETCNAFCNGQSLHLDRGKIYPLAEAQIADLVRGGHIKRLDFPPTLPPVAQAVAVERKTRKRSEKDMPTLEVLTRCYKRPTMLEANKASVKTLGEDVLHSFVVDDVGLGIAESYRQLARIEPLGRYLWILDDDDVCIYPGLADDVRRISQQHNPDVIIVRMDHGPRGILPDDDHWQQAPELGYIGVSAPIVHWRTWEKYAHVLADRAAYTTDYAFIRAMYDGGATFYWHDVVASRVQRISTGAPE